MAARSGLFVDPVPGATPVGTSMADARRALATLTGTTFRAATGGAVGTSASTMQVTVSQSVWVIPDPLDAASTFLSPTDAFTGTLTSAPASGSRIDLLVVKQNNFAGGDADSRANVSIVAGVAGTPGVAPATPTGAQVIAQITVPASITNSNAATVTYKVPQAVQAPPQINVATLALLNVIPGSAVGQEAAVTNDATVPNNGLYLWSGSQWVQVATFGVWTPFAGTVASPAYPTGFQNAGIGYVPSYKVLGDTVILSGVLQKTGAANFVAGDSFFTVPFPPSQTSYQLCEAAGSGMVGMQIAAGGVMTIHNLKGSTTSNWISIEGWTYRRY